MSGNIHPTNCECSYCTAPLKFDSVVDAESYIRYLEAEKEFIEKEKHERQT